ncbi:divalent-cation tolerance protein CutA [Streptomyces sp. NPDC046985]|uniref:divalent-cation tolerance protein CutA n=1 Tax=Streptomyces sp. NPDC046985 TaxID=3155377 RepID=UPI0033FC973E
MNDETVLAQTTVDDEDQAKALARGAVEGGLAACAHIDAPLTAVYRWEGEVQTAQEWRVSYKTTPDRLPDLEAWVTARHPYDVPEWIVLPVTGGSQAYAAWVVAQTRPD